MSKKKKKKQYFNKNIISFHCNLLNWLTAFLRHINHCRLFNTKSFIYIYIYISGDSSLFLLLVPPHPVNFSSQPVVRGPKVSHHSCYCVILHCIAQIDKRTLHGVFFCKQSRYYIICSLVNTVDKIIFFLSKV